MVPTHGTVLYSSNVMCHMCHTLCVTLFSAKRLHNLLVHLHCQCRNRSLLFPVDELHRWAVDKCLSHGSRERWSTSPGQADGEEFLKNTLPHKTIWSRAIIGTRSPQNVNSFFWFFIKQCHKFIQQYLQQLGQKWTFSGWKNKRF